MLRMVLGIAIAITAMMPAIGMADDQAIADYIKSRLQTEQQRGNLRGFNVDMRVDRGTVWFTGHVSNTEQEQTILSAAQGAGHLGVVQIVDDIEINGQSPAMESFDYDQAYAPQAEYTAQAGYQQQIGTGAIPTPPFQQAAPLNNQPLGTYPNAQQALAPSSTPLPFAQAAGSGVPAQQISYGNNVGMGGGMGMDMGGAMAGGYGGAMGMTGSPNMPGYAWPGYAAHPNYAALTYPQQYSPSAWPYIGPFYPYPQVPLGWRKVTLEWDDGWWMLDFKDK